VIHGGVNYGTLELRWSTACKTNWGRFSTTKSIGIVAVSVVRLADNLVCGDPPGNGCNEYFRGTPNTIYSNQLNGCHLALYAKVRVWNGGAYFDGVTPTSGTGC
jgi:hypothetical protein